MKRILSLLAAATLAGCTLNTGPANNPTDPATETFAASLGVDIPTMTKTAVGDYYKDLKIGTGTVVNGDAFIGFNYTGYLKDGTTFTTGSIAVTDTPQEEIANLILGLQDALQGMAVGGERLIVIPSQYGFGTSTFTSGGVTVPPNSTLVFDVTLTGLAAVP